MWTKDFWKGTAERAIRGGAAALISAWAVGDGVMNAFNVNWHDAGGLFLGGAVVSVAFSLAGGTLNSQPGPSLTGVETTGKFIP